MNLPKNGVAWVVRGIVEKNTCPNYILSVNIALVEDILEKCQLEINVGRIKKKNKQNLSLSKDMFQKIYCF